MSEAPDRFETLGWVYSQSELAILLSLFEWEDIFVLPVSRHHIAVQWTWAVALGGIELRVHRADAERARALLAPVDQNEAYWAPVFFRDRWADAMLILALFFLFIPVAVARIPAQFLLYPAATRSAPRPHKR